MVAVDRRVTVLVLSLLLVFSGGVIGYWGHTAGGTVEVRDVQFQSADGTQMSGHLYVPAGVSADDPAPGVLAVHGYVNTKGVQAPFATEYARRGYVVLALDQTGHGGSAPPAFAGGFGGPAGLAYLNDRPMVTERVAVTGHSMGGWAITAAAASDPDGYDAALYQGSAPGPIAGLPVPNGTAEFPRNTGVVFSEYDEFHWLMWPGSASAATAEETQKMQEFFGTDATVEEGRTYGSIEDGTARRLYTPATTHPGDHISTNAVADSVDWIQRTLPGGESPAPSNQVWYWKEVGTFLALLGGMLFVFPAGGLLLDREPFSSLQATVPQAATERDAGWHVSALLATLIPAVTYFPTVVAGDSFVPLAPNWLFPQQLTNAVVLWALVNTVVIAGLVGAWHVRRTAEDRVGRLIVPAVLVGSALGIVVASVADFLVTGQDLLGLPTVVGTLLVGVTLGGWLLTRGSATDRAASTAYGLSLPQGWGSLTRSVGLAVGVVGGVYALSLVVDALFNVDFRVWFVAFRLLTPWQFQAFVAYLPLLFVFFVAVGVLLHGRLRTRATTDSLRRAMVINSVILTGGMALLLALQYGVLFTSNALPIPQLALYAIVGLPFVPALPLIAVVSTYFFHRTGRVWTGALVNALLITWFLVGSTATQAVL
ncbi:alpha/beta hydrolase family protein [Salinirubrum litoreum]|uniref:Alpha/beta hydrolase family protein n=1 Tax=Salinirubrum litoreum TaxID=1126234 RepID=A0ABD5RH57_9EURY|nr:alpha/beta hydrolase [Salinirubrum litoreum]